MNLVFTLTSGLLKEPRSRVCFMTSVLVFIWRFSVLIQNERVIFVILTKIIFTISARLIVSLIFTLFFSKLY